MTTAVKLGQKWYWVIVADTSTAIIYEHETRSSRLQKLIVLKNDVARLKTESLISDRGGRSFDSHGEGRHTFAREKSGPKTHAAIAFAKEVAEQITDAKHAGTCQQFALIATPHFLGLVRSALATAGDARPYLAIDKEMVGQDTADIEKLLKID